MDNQPLKEQKIKYLDLVQEATGNSEENDTIFVWKNSFLTIYIFEYENLSNRKFTLIIASKNTTKDKLVTRVLSNEEIGLEFRNSHITEEQISILIENDLLPIESTDIVYYSKSILENINEFGLYLFSQEYNNASSHFPKRPIELLNFNSIRLHADKYKMAEMIDGLNNPQFTAELSECLFAYENEKFYICATGIGSLIEHMMYLAIEKHGDPSYLKGNLTTDSYIGILRKEPFKIDRRAASYIRSVMGFRNSVSHFNSGFTSKELCDQLFNGLKNIYTNYYLSDPVPTVSK